jgi:acylpyruvate hydrolase
MIFRIPQLIEHVSSIMTLEEGDLLLTGTPSGVGPISADDEIECTLTDPQSGNKIAAIQFTVIDRKGGYHFKPSD